MAVVLLGMRRDSRPEYDEDEEELSGVLRETSRGLCALVEYPALRLASATLIALLLFEGFADVLLVVMALELLHLGEGSVGFLNASWGFGALLGGAGLALLLDRGRLVVAIAGGSLVVGAATMLPGAFPEPATAYLSWLAIGDRPPAQPPGGPPCQRRAMAGARPSCPKPPGMEPKGH